MSKYHLTLRCGSAIFFMTTKNHTPKTVFEKLTTPLKGIVNHCKNYRNCKSLSDQQWIETGLLRTLSQEPSGRGFLQKLIDTGRSPVKRSHFFETLKSKRRLKLCREVSFKLYQDIKNNNLIDDPFQEFKGLSDYDIYAGDGHYHAAAAHDIIKGGKKYPTQHFYSVNLRNGALNHLTLADTSGKRKKEHDMRALKRLDTETLRQGTKIGRKVIYIWDKAGIDFRQWFKWKHSAGIYFISREKENMDLLLMENFSFDRNDNINQGVESFRPAATSTGVMVNHISYKCPITGESFKFITNLLDVPPGLIAYLYKTRWDIEKIFDQVKNKLNEKKAWATSDTAKEMQAQFICLVHNLMLLLDDHIKKQGVDNHIENNRRSKRLRKVLRNIQTKHDKIPVFLSTTKRPALRSVKFIRWLRNNLFANTSWIRALESLRLVYDDF